MGMDVHLTVPTKGLMLIVEIPGLTLERNVMMGILMEWMVAIVRV